MSRSPLRLHHRLAAALAWLLLICTQGSALAAVGLLGPPDTSSPQATLSSFFRLTDKIVERYIAYREAPSPATQRVFLRTVDQGKLLMDLSGVAPAAQHEIATATIVWLWEVIARVELPPLAEIPDAAAYAAGGALADQPPRWRLPGTAIVIERVEQGPHAGEFLFSPQTIATARSHAEFARELPYLRPPRIDKVSDLSRTALGFSGWMLPPHLIQRLPQWAHQPIAGQVVWKWGVALTTLVMALALPLLVARWARRRPWDTRLTTLLRRLSAPLALMVSLQLSRWFLNDQVWVTGRLTAVPDYLAKLATGLALSWSVLLLARWVPEAWVGAVPNAAAGPDASLIRWVARVIALLVILVLLFSAAQDLGIPVYGLVAGAGVGGLAIALAARPTLANFLGALNLFADRPIRVGDLCRFDEQHGQGWNPIGRVEAIGLRSTRIRQFDRSVISIPNADLVERNIVNYSTCEKILLQQRLALRHETSDAQLHALLQRLRELLQGHPQTIHSADDPVRVRFLGFHGHALSVELRAYLRATTWSGFLIIQEDIMLQVMRCVKEAGIAFAIPAQTLYLTRDQDLAAVRGDRTEPRVDPGLRPAQGDDG